MKKLFSKLMLMGLAALAFTACEDVPEPYDVPGTGTNIPGTSTEIEGGTGDGTYDTPFNTIAALNYGNELASGEESPEYMYVKGRVVSIKEEFSTQFGNGTFYISEDGSALNQFYAYRVLYLGNKKFTANDTQIKVGDEVIICGIITNYNGTIETAQNKGFLYSLNGENRGGEPTQGVASKPVGEGTLESPYNAAAAIQLAQKVGEAESDDVYIKGKVVNITEQYGTQFGNATFTISDDGTNASTTFTIWRALYLGNKKFASGDTEIKEGDDVIIYGKVTNFKGNTPETVQNKAYLYSLNGNTGGGETPQPQGEAKGDGTLNNPFNSVAAAQEALKLADKAVSDKSYYIKGKVASIVVDRNGNVQNYDYGTFGNATFYISDDGTEAGQFQVYRALYLGNKKWEQGAGDVLKVGDEVVVYGKLTNYNGTPETAQGEAYLYSLNGKTEGSGGENPNPQPDGDTEGSIDAPKTVADALAAINALEDGATTTAYYYIKGKVAKLANNAEDIGTKYKDVNYYISDDGTESNTLYIYRGKNLNNTDFTSADQIQVGDEVIVYGRLQKYKNTKTNEIVPEMAQGNYIVKTSNNGGGGSGENPNPGGGEVSGTGSYSEPYSVAAVIANGTSNTVQGVYIKGYIVGWVDGQVLASGANFNGQATVKTNLLIADNATETDVAKCVPVQLPNNAVRTGLNLQDNPKYYGKQVMLYGNLEKYFGAAGVKGVTYAECDGDTMGSKP